MTEAPITLQDIYAARRAIAGQVLRTPLLASRSLTAHCGLPVHLKVESLQPTGSFKIRGATNRVAMLNEAERQRGVVRVSCGNPGPALARAASLQGVPAVICLSRQVPANKVANVRANGGEVRIVGQSFDEAAKEAARLVAEQGLTMVHPFDDRFVAAGAGTIGLELLEDLPDLRTALVPLSGGGLIGGVALALKSVSPDIRVIGICMERGAAMYESLRAGHPVEVEELGTLADALTGGIGLDNRYTFDLVRRHVDQVILLDEAQIARGMGHAFREERLVAEGSGAVGIAALLEGLVGDLVGPVAVVVSGANVDPDQLLQVLNGQVPEV